MTSGMEWGGYCGIWKETMEEVKGGGPATLVIEVALTLACERSGAYILVVYHGSSVGKAADCDLQKGGKKSGAKTMLGRSHSWNRDDLWRWKLF